MKEEFALRFLPPAEADSLIKGILALPGFQCLNQPTGLCIIAPNGLTILRHIPTKERSYLFINKLVLGESQK